MLMLQNLSKAKQFLESYLGNAPTSLHAQQARQLQQQQNNLHARQQQHHQQQMVLAQQQQQQQQQLQQQQMMGSHGALMSAQQMAHLTGPQVAMSPSSTTSGGAGVPGACL
jgi:aspartokinase